MTVATFDASPVYPRKLGTREAKVIEAALASSATKTQTFTNKTIDGDDNTVQDLPVTALKTATGNADKALVGTASTGVPKFAKLVDANVDASAAIALSKLVQTTGDAGKILQCAATTGIVTSVAMSGDATIAAGGAVAIGNNKVVLAMLAAGVTPGFLVKKCVTGVTGTSVAGVLVSDYCLKIDTVGGGAGLVTWALCVAPDTFPLTLAPGDLGIALRAAA